MTFAQLKQKNPNVPLYEVTDPEFAAFGRVVTGLDVSELTAAAANKHMPAIGSMYEASTPEFEETAVAAKIAELFFGTLPTEVGYCYGANSLLNAAEWHMSSEVNVAVTPLVLILGDRRDLVNNELDSAQMKAFFVPAGTVLEIYATTLHFCPCQTEAGGFGCVVALPKGTNLPLESETEDKLLFRQNKWLIAHKENTALIARGAVPGIGGVNYQIKW